MTPYGRVSESGYASSKVRGSYYYAIREIGLDAIYEAQSSLARKLRTLRPPTPEEADDAILKALYTSLTRR
jgi:hypothetical protein